jgi:hypothetical protein
MAEKTFSFEDVEKAVNSTDFDALEKKAAKFKAASASPADILDQICPTYRAIRPILVGLTQIPFVPTSWKKAIKAFIRTMDLVCPQR